MVYQCLGAVAGNVLRDDIQVLGRDAQLFGIPVHVTGIPIILLYQFHERIEQVALALGQ